MHNVGAKLGAISGGRLWTAMDDSGIGRLSFRAVSTVVDLGGRCLEIHGSDGWGLSLGDRCEFSRTCNDSPTAGDFTHALLVDGVSPGDLWSESPD